MPRIWFRLPLVHGWSENEHLKIWRSDFMVINSPYFHLPCNYYYDTIHVNAEWRCVLAMDVGGRVVAGEWHIAGRIIRSVHGYLTYILFPFPFTRPQISWRRNEIRLDNESRGSWKWIEYEIILYPLSVWSPLSRRKIRTIIIIGLISVSSWSSVWVSGSRNEFYFLSSSGSALPLAQERTFSHRNSQVEYA